MNNNRNSSNRVRATSRYKRTSLGAVIALGGFFLLATIIAAYLIFSTVRDFVATWNAPANGNIVIKGGTVVGGSTVNPKATISPITAKAWNGTDRVTILLLGIDQRAGETDTAYRSDSMMLVTLDPVGRTVGVLSIPRDLYVTIPGFPDRDKITTANFKGDAYRLPGGGAKLAKDTVEATLGIRVNYYVRINFTAFETLIDQMGGVDVDNPTAIDDPQYPDSRYGYDPFSLPAGKQHLDGKTALKYARTRHNTGDDFGRAQRQQQIGLAIRDKVVSANMLPTLISKAPQFIATLSGSYTTDMSPEQIVSLALLGKDIPRDKITTEVIDKRYIADFYTTNDGQQVLILNIEKFRELRDKMFYTPQPVLINVPDAAQYLLKEGARVEVQNGSNKSGVAATAADYLRAKGINVVSVGNADRNNYTTTTIADLNNKPYTAKWIADTLRLPQANIITGSKSANGADIRIIIGADFVLPNN
ncbi:MAG: LCP family protein [Chloroflexota bacterium]